MDGGHFFGFPTQDIPVSEPSRYIFTMDFGSIGLGLGAAVGAAVAHPDRVTVTAIGDGGLMMSLGELDTAVRYELPILIIVYNDAAYGAELHFLRMSGIDDREARFEVPALDRIARAMGAQGHAIRSIDDLTALAPELADIKGPMLLDCRVTDRVRAVWLEEAFQRGTH
jgi:thiamine pyrophosphate-dependent acetolactate synthase large subunit-like protein